MKALILLLALSSPVSALELDPELRGPDPVCKPTVVALTVERACHDHLNCAPGSRCIGDVDCPVGQRCVGGDCR